MNTQNIYQEPFLPWAVEYSCKAKSSNKDGALMGNGSVRLSKAFSPLAVTKAGSMPTSYSKV